MKKKQNIEFVQSVNFHFIDSIKNNGTKYLLNFDASCKEICNSKTFFDIAIAGRHRGLSTTYIKPNKANMGETLSSRTRTLFSSNLPVM